MSLTPPADFQKYVVGTSSTYSIGDPTPFSVPLGGAIISPNLTGVFNRYEGQVTINFNQTTNSAVANNIIYTGAGAIPTKYLPTANTYCNINVLNDDLVKLGTVEVRTDGTLEFFVEGHTKFDNSNHCGILRGSITYTV
jgi:hypothetical protein